MSNYLKYQSREDRWIFYKKDKGWQYKGHSYRDHDDNEFFTWDLLMIQINVERIIKEKENNILFFLNILVWFGNVIIVIMYHEVFLILLVNIKIIYNLHSI